MMVDVVNKLGNKFSKRMLCYVLELNRSTTYDRRKRAKKPKNKKIEKLEAAIIKIALTNKAYGYKRVTAEAKRKKYTVGKRRVYNTMKANSLLRKKKKKWIRTTNSNHSNPVFPNLVLDIEVTGVNQLWVGDVTYVPLGNGRFAYVATLKDVHSRKVVGWHTSMNIDSQLCLNALNMALETRKGESLYGLIHHTDQGSTYTSNEYKKALADHNITGSMARKGNPYDNAFAETLFKTLKYECLNWHEIETYFEVCGLVNDFFKQYNTTRLHSSIGYRPPDELENLYLKRVFKNEENSCAIQKKSDTLELSVQKSLTQRKEDFI